MGAARTDDPGAAVADGELHAELHGEKLRGRFVLVRTRPRRARDWILLHKRDEYAEAGWDPEEHPRSVLSRAHQRRGEGRPGPAVALRPPAAEASVSLSPRRRDAEDEPDELEGARPSRDSGTVFGRELKVTNLDKVLFPARAAEAGHQAGLSRYTAQIAPTSLPYLTAGR